MQSQMRKVLLLVLSLVLTIAVESASVSAQTAQSKIPAELAGEWHNGNVSMLGEKNLQTGTISAANGSTFTYKFSANARFEFIGLMQSTMYGCTTSLFNHKTGKVEIDGSTITFIPDKNYWKNTYSCSPKSNKERNYTLEKETKEFELREDEQGRRLFCLLDGEKDACYREKE